MKERIRGGLAVTGLVLSIGSLAISEETNAGYHEAERIVMSSDDSARADSDTYKKFSVDPVSPEFVGISFGIVSLSCAAIWILSRQQVKKQ